MACGSTSRCFSDQVYCWFAGVVAVESWCRCYSSPEPTARNRVSVRPGDLLSTRRTDCGNEHRRATHSRGLCLSIRADQRCCVGIDSKESKMGLRSWIVAVDPCSLIGAGVSQLHRVFK